jgi:hypothetical protein
MRPGRGPRFHNLIGVVSHLHRARSDQRPSGIRERSENGYQRDTSFHSSVFIQVSTRQGLSSAFGANAVVAMSVRSLYLLRRLIKRYHFMGAEYQPILRLNLRSALGTAWVAFHTGLSYTPAARSTRLRARVKPSMVLTLGLRNLIVG